MCPVFSFFLALSWTGRCRSSDRQNSIPLLILSTALPTYLVTIIDGRGDLTEDATRFRFGQDFALAEVIVELATGRVLHHQDHLLLVLKHFVDVDDVGVPDGGHDLNFAPDADQIGFRFDFGLFDCFNGHLDWTHNRPNTRSRLTYMFRSDPIEKKSH